MVEYNNPILLGFNPDPSIIRVGSNFFLVTSTFEFFPGLPIYHSTDLIKWNLIGHGINRTTQLRIATPEPGGGLWAPTLRYHDGTFYLLCASFDRYRPQADDRVWPQGFYVKTVDIWNDEAWSDPIYSDQVGFDQDIFWDDDGTAYLCSTYRKDPRTIASPLLKDFAIHISTIDMATGNSTSSPVCIRSSSSGVSEGSHILKRNGYYYLFTAEGGTESGHSEWVSRSSNSPLGPWELGPTNPLWRNTVHDDVQNTGHADLVEDKDGYWWAVLLAVRPIKVASGFQPSVFGRETFLVPVTWENDWPTFNHGEKISLRGSAPGTSVYKLKSAPEWEDKFQSSILSLGWYRKNTPLKKDYELRDGRLRLYGGPYTLSSPACPTAWFRKQCSQGTWTTRLSFKPSFPRYEAGTCIYWNYFTFASIGIRKSPSKDLDPQSQSTATREVKFTLSSPDVKADKQVHVISESYSLRDAESDVVLFIVCEQERYRLGYIEVAVGNVVVDVAEATWVDSNILTTTLMARDPPVGAPFTGMMLGLYSLGENQKCLDPADFHYARFS